VIRETLAASRTTALWLIVPALGVAAPPEVTALYPAGGQQGTTVKVALQGKVETDKLQLWCDRPGVELAGPDGKEGVELKIAPDVPAGWCWLGFFNAEGAAAQRPFYIGGVPELLEDESNNRISEANKIAALPAVMNGVLRRSGDVDTFSCELKAGQTLVAALTARQQIDSPFDALLQVTDARGFVMKQSDDVAGSDPHIAFTAPADGLYAVRVFGFPGTPDSSIRFAGNANFIYRLMLTTGPFVGRTMPCAVQQAVATTVAAEGWNLPSGAEIELPALPAGVRDVGAPGWLSAARVLSTPFPVALAAVDNSRAKAQAVSLPACVAGQLAPGADQAWKFAAKKGEKLSLRATARALGSPLDVVLRIVDAKGQTLQEVDDAVQDHADAVLDFTAPDDGEFTAIVRDRFAHGGPEYIYALTIALPQPDFALSVANDAFTLTPGKDFELSVNVEARAGFDGEVEIRLDGLPEGCTAEPVKITPQASGSSGRSGRSGGRRGGSSPSNAAKLVIKTTTTDGWSGEFRVVAKSLGDAPLERVAVGKPANTDRPRQILRAVIQVKSQ
jgi:hypothetical protein